MLQVTQYQKTGELRVEELPEPRTPAGGVLVRNVCSLISAGTERTSVETAQASLIGKARSRPDLVRQVMDNARREGLLATYRKVQSRLDNIKELGYSSAGVVIESDVEGIVPGDRVACAGTAYHAEVVAVRGSSSRESQTASVTTLPQRSRSAPSHSRVSDRRGSDSARASQWWDSASSD